MAKTIKAKPEETSEAASTRRLNFLSKEKDNIKKLSADPKNMIDDGEYSSDDEDEDDLAFKNLDTDKDDDSDIYEDDDDDKKPKEKPEKSIQKFKIEGVDMTEEEMIENKNSGLRRDDYTKKTQEHAENMKKEKTQVAEIHQEATEISEFFGALKKNDTVWSIVKESIVDTVENGQALIDKVMNFNPKKFVHPLQDENTALKATNSDLQADKAYDDIIEHFSSVNGLKKEEAEKVFDETLKRSAVEAKKRGVPEDQYILPMRMVFNEMKAEGQFSKQRVEVIDETKDEIDTVPAFKAGQGAQQITDDTSKQDENSRKKKRSQYIRQIEEEMLDW